MTNDTKKRALQAQQQGPRAVGSPAWPSQELRELFQRYRAPVAVFSREQPSVPACDHCGGSHGTRTCPEVKAQHDGRGRR